MSAVASPQPAAPTSERRTMANVPRIVPDYAGTPVFLHASDKRISLLEDFYRDVGVPGRLRVARLLDACASLGSWTPARRSALPRSQMPLKLRWIVGLRFLRRGGC